MAETLQKAWVCQVCGYIHYGPEAPEECPVCGAGAQMFEPEAPPAPVEASRASLAPLRVLIAGAGIAGVAAAEAVRQARPQAEILLASEEPELPYYRLNLTRFLAGELSLDQLELHPAEWYRDHRIELLRGSPLEELDLERKQALCGSRRLGFDRLILTVGSRPFLPALPGVNLANVTALRTRQDAMTILALAPGKECVVIGGGLLGLETAGALAGRGVRVSLLENQDWLLPRQLNRRAGELLRRHVEGLGIHLYPGARVKQLLGQEAVEAVLLEDGSCLPAGLVIISAGVRANLQLARATGLALNQGILVDTAMRTSHPDVFAAGDCAEHDDLLYGTWAPSQVQGAVAGANAVGGSAAFQPVPRSNTLKVLGIELFSIGRIAPLPTGLVIEGGEPHYAWFHFEGDLLTGAILLGDASLSASLKKAIEGRRSFSGLLPRDACCADVFQVLQNL